MVSPSARRRAARQSVESGLGSKAAACRALRLARSGFYRMARASVESRRLRKEVLEFSARHPRYGYRRLTALLRREGFEVNPKRVARIRREEGIKVSKKQRRMKRLGISTAQRARAERPRQVWSWDFVEDQTENGSRFRILTILDEHTRQCVAVHAAWSIRAVDVITVPEAAIARYGAPEHLRSDNGKLCKPGIPTRTGLVRCQAAALGGSQRRPGNEPRGNRPRQVQERGLLVSQR
jgi:putative transposase